MKKITCSIILFLALPTFASNQFAYLATDGQSEVIRAQSVSENFGNHTCSFVKYEKCMMRAGTSYVGSLRGKISAKFNERFNERFNETEVTDLSSVDLTCSPLFYDFDKISTGAVSEVLRGERNRGNVKVGGAVLVTLAAAATAFVAIPIAGGGFVGGSGFLSSSVVGGSGSTLALFGGDVVVGSSSVALGTTPVVLGSAPLTRYFPQLRYINPWFNGAIVKVLETTPNETRELINTAEFIQEASAVESSMNSILAPLVGKIERSTGCPAIIK